MIGFKSEKVRARFTGLNPTLQAICQEMGEYCRARGKELVLTETMTTEEEDKALGRVSVTHREGRAVDIRTRDWPEEFRALFTAEFTSKFGRMGAVSKDGKRNLLVYHDSGHGAHIHCQLEAKFRVEKP